MRDIQSNSLNQNPVNQNLNNYKVFELFEKCSLEMNVL